MLRAIKPQNNHLEALALELLVLDQVVQKWQEVCFEAVLLSLLLTKNQENPQGIVKEKKAKSLEQKDKGETSVKYTDPDGRIFGIDNLVGAAIGGIIGAGAEVAVQMFTGKYNAGAVALAAGTGFVLGALTDGLTASGSIASATTRIAAVRAAGATAKAVLPKAAGNVVNRAGKVYPRIIDLRTGKPISFPEGDLKIVPKEARVDWGRQERADFIKEWYDKGFKTPEGGWEKYDIHHIRPREYGGTNDFNNLVPVPRDQHVSDFNSFWRDF